MPCVKLTLTNNKFFFLLSQEKAFRTCFFTSTPSKSLSGLLTGSLVGLFVLCHACHSDKDSLWLHSSGDSLSSNCLAEELTEKWKTWEACVCLCAVCVGVRNRRRRCKGLLHSMCWLNVCVCVHALSNDFPMSASVSVLSTYPLCAHKDSSPNCLSQCLCNDSHYGTMWSRAVIDTSQALLIDESLIYK